MMWYMRRYDWSNQISRRSLDNLTTFTSIWQQLVQSCFYPVSHSFTPSRCFFTGARWSHLLLKSVQLNRGMPHSWLRFRIPPKKVAAFVKSKVDVAALLLHFTTSKESNLVAAAGCKNKIYFKIIKIISNFSVSKLSIFWTVLDSV